MIGCLLLLSSVFASAEPLKWGADPEGGAPYIFADPADPKTWIGYEVDLMRELGKELGRGETFVQNPWDSLIPSLQRGSYDAAVNGLEITDDRKQVIAFSDPYYVTYLQLTVRHDNETIHSLKDCALHRVGTLKGTLAQRILDSDANIEVITYESQVTVYEDLALGRIAAVLLDWPIAQYYAVPNRKLKNVGAPIARVLYGIGIRKSDTKLTVDINGALERLWAKGAMREIYERWGLWNSLVAAEFSRFGTTQPTTTQPTEYQKYLKSVGAERTWQDQVQKYWGILPILGQGALITLKVSVFSMLLAMFVGLWIALGRLYGPPALSRAMIWYVEVMRGTPLLVQLYLIFYGLPNIGIRLSPIVAAVIGLGFNYAACESENYRAGIL